MSQSQIAALKTVQNWFMNIRNFRSDGSSEKTMHWPRIKRSLSLTAGTTRKVKETEANWEKERKSLFEWSPSKALIKSYRQYNKICKLDNIFLFPIRQVLKWKFRFWSAFTGSDIHPSATIAGGLVLPHPTGVVIHRNAIIGSNCTLMQQVTIGQTAINSDVPKLGDCVYVGAGAKIIGKVCIGNFVSIGANAVVLTDVPDNATAVGIPARVLAK